MRRTFLIWLSAVLVTTFVIIGTLVYSQFANHARERAEQMMSTRLMDMLEMFRHADRSISYLSNANDSSTLDRTRALAEIISLNPSILKNQEELQGICNRLGAEQIVICDEEGRVEAAVPQSYVGYNIEAGDEIRLLIAGEDGMGSEICGPISHGETQHQGIMQYAGVRRIDKPGFVRLGFRTRWEQLSRAESSFDYSAGKLRLGDGGRIAVFRRGMCLASGKLAISQAELLALPPDEVREVPIDGKNYFLYAVDGGGYRLIGLLPAKEIYKSSLGAVQFVLLSNLLLFIIMFAVVSYLLQRIVLQGISKVNEALREITEGDLEKRVDVGDSPEFQRLSNGINFMVDSLRSVGEERQQGIKRGLELARTLQSTVLPDKFPPFPHINSFDLYACCLQASEVGGDFYDFSMPDEQHLHFLVADVDASGVPAALFMMRAISILRTFAKSGQSPVDIVTNANRELCEGNQAGIRMALFFGSLNITTGELEYVNAGNLSAWLQHEGGDYVPMGGQTDYILAEREDFSFHSSTLHMEPQDRLLFYTEGVMGVTNTNNTPFNEQRLQETLRTPAATVTDVLQLVRSSLRQYAGGERFHRDITMLCLEYKGEPANKAQLAFAAGEPAEAEELIAQQLEELFAAPLDIADVQASVRTVLAALPPACEVRMDLRCTETQAEVELMYPAPLCNPLEQVSPLPVDHSTFEFTENQENRLTLWKTLT